MSGNDLSQAEELFHECLELPAEDWPGFLWNVCGDDEQLAKEVASLLAARTNADIESLISRIARYFMQYTEDAEDQHPERHERQPESHGHRRADPTSGDE